MQWWYFCPSSSFIYGETATRPQSTHWIALDTYKAEWTPAPASVYMQWREKQLPHLHNCKYPLTLSTLTFKAGPTDVNYNKSPAYIVHKNSVKKLNQTTSFLLITFIHSMVLQPFVGPWPLLQFRNPFYTNGRTPWTSDQPIARPLPTQRTTETQNKRAHRHSCIEWDSNLRSQHLSERRQFMP
jgi:hypothetical protein